MPYMKLVYHHTERRLEQISRPYDPCRPRVPYLYRSRQQENQGKQKENQAEALPPSCEPLQYPVSIASGFPYKVTCPKAAYLKYRAVRYPVKLHCQEQQAE